MAPLFKCEKCPRGSDDVSIADEFGLRQLVNEPTRGPYLLDLLLTDLDDAKVEILPAIADHNALLTKFVFPIPKTSIMSCDVWHFKNAAWTTLSCDLRACDWRRLKFGSVDDAANSFFLGSSFTVPAHRTTVFNAPACDDSFRCVQSDSTQHKQSGVTRCSHADRQDCFSASIREFYLLYFIASHDHLVKDCAHRWP